MLCHFGCSTFDHNYPVVRFLKNWRRTKTDRFAYWTTAPSNSGNRPIWLFHVLTYPEYNAWESWHPSLKYAVK